MSLKKAASGIFSAEFRRRSLQGGRLSLSLRTKSKAVANRRHAQLLQLLDLGRLDIIDRVRSGEMTILEVDRALAIGGQGISALDVFHEGISLGRARELLRTQFALQQTRASSRFVYENIIGYLIAEFGEDTPLASLSEPQLHSWFANLDISSRTQRQRRAVYRRLWKAAIRAEKQEAAAANLKPRLVDNPWLELKVARPKNPSEHAKLILTPDEAMNLLAANRGTPECAFMALAYLAGLRQQEAANLRREDIDLDEGILRICEHQRPAFWTPKTANSLRSVPIAESLRLILVEHFARGFASRIYLFTGRDATLPLAPGTARSRWHRAYRRAGYTPGRDESGLVYHTGRHSFISWALALGEPPANVAEYVGDTVAVLMDTYAHVLPKGAEAVRDAVQTMIDAALSSEKSSSGVGSLLKSQRLSAL